MIFYNKKNLKEQIIRDYKELENYKNSYSKRISLYNIYLDTMEVFEEGVIQKNGLNKEELENKKKTYQLQISKIDNNLGVLNEILKNINTNEKKYAEKKTLNKYNEKYKEIKNNYISNSVFEEKTTENYINGLMLDLAKTLEKMKEKHEKEIEKIIKEQTINQLDVEPKKEIIKEVIKENQTKDDKHCGLKNNNTLLISEKLGKVILPYRAEEVLEIFNNEKNKYETVEEVIEDKFTRKFSDYKIPFTSRYNETMKLAKERENFNFIDAVTLATEMMNKRFLHPAIISACRSLNELDVYLDCLDKNELEDFKIFKIKYELYPAVVKPKHSKTRFR